MRRKSRITILVICLLIFISGIALANEQLKIHFLDVGQADSIFIQLPSGQTMLIDGGNNDDGQLVINYLKKFGISQIDFLIGTHPHEDHIGGLDVVIKEMKIGKIYLPRVTHTTRTFEDLLLAIKAKGKKIITAKSDISLINQPDLKIYFLAPVKGDYEELNHYSAVLKIDYGQTGFLFTGDAEEINEIEMEEKYGNSLSADLLKVGHHGSSSSTTEHFIQAVNPKYAVISVGKDNRYGHPSLMVLHHLRDHNTKIFRTDKLGTIICISDGKTLKFNQNEIETIQKVKNANIQIVKVDLKEELVVIKNTGNKNINVSGWKLVSLKGNQIFNFPDGIILKPSELLKIDTGPGATSAPGQLKWTGRYIWNNDGDPAALYNTNGQLVSSWD